MRIQPVVMILALGWVLLSCGKTATIKVTASSSKTLTISKVGTLSVRLELRELEAKSIAVTWLTWNGDQASTVTGTVKVFRYDSSLLKELVSADVAAELDAGADKSIATDQTDETRRKCASATLSLSAYDANGDTVTVPATMQACEKL